MKIRPDPDSLLLRIEHVRFAIETTKNIPKEEKEIAKEYINRLKDIIERYLR